MPANGKGIGVWGRKMTTSALPSGHAGRLQGPQSSTPLWVCTCLFYFIKMKQKTDRGISYKPFNIHPDETIETNFAIHVNFDGVTSPTARNVPFFM